jgi:hypothetical protein
MVLNYRKYNESILGETKFKMGEKVIVSGAIDGKYFQENIGVVMGTRNGFFIEVTHEIFTTGNYLGKMEEKTQLYLIRFFGTYDRWIPEECISKYEEMKEEDIEWF